MDCPRCGHAMREETLGGHHSRAVAIDLCVSCQALWFDARESLSLTPASTLALFRVIGERVSRPEPFKVDLEKCPRCRGRLRITHDMQRAVRFYRALGFEILYGGETSSFTSFQVGTAYLNLTAQPDGQRWSWWGRIIFYVSDVDEFHDRVLAAGFQPETVPRDAQWGES